jgi:hypothetical protein
MCLARFTGTLGGEPIVARSRNAVAGWALATVLVILAVVGPPLTRQGIPALLEMRRDILTIDREFERSSIRTANAVISDDFGRAGSSNTRSRTHFRGGVL